MKKLFLSGLLMICAISASAQRPDLSMIGFRPIAISKSAPESAGTYLEGKVSDILTTEGIAHTTGDFIIEISINEVNKVLTPTAPPRYQVQLEITFKAIDQSQGVVFNSMTVSASGMNTSESAAYMAAVRSVNFRTRNFLNFIDVSKEKLYDYYQAGYAIQPEPEPEPQPVPEPAPVPAPVPAPAPEPVPAPVPAPEVVPAPAPAPVVAPEKPGYLLANDIYVEYLGTEKKGSTVDLILRMTNYGDADEVIDFSYTSQVLVDGTGKNIKQRYIRHNDGSGISGFTLINGVPVTVRFGYEGASTVPAVLYFYEKKHDSKIRINCR